MCEVHRITKNMSALQTLGDVSDVCSDIVMLLNGYFAGLMFTRLEQKEGFVLYGACVASGLAGGYKRYIIALVPATKAHLDRCTIAELQWKVLQARVLFRSYRLREQAWKMTRDMGDMILRVKQRDAKASHYQPESCVKTRLPQMYEIVLLHDPKKKTQYQYNNRITLSAAVETFHMIFTIHETPITNSHPPHPHSSSLSSSHSSHHISDGYSTTEGYTAPEMRGWDTSYTSGAGGEYMPVTSQNRQLVAYNASPSDAWYETPVPPPEEETFQRI